MEEEEESTDEELIKFVEKIGLNIMPFYPKRDNNRCRWTISNKEYGIFDLEKGAQFKRHDEVVNGIPFFIFKTWRRAVIAFMTFYKELVDWKEAELETMKEKII